jgi:hypothetical protein
MRAALAKTIWRSIKARLAWRESPRRALDDDTPEGRGDLPFERIVSYALDGYTPLWMKKGIVDPWYPTDRWDTLPRSAVKDSPETEWFLWIARFVDRIEAEGRMRDFKAEGAKPNPYREAILDEVCLEAFGTKHPTKENVYFQHGTVVARMFGRGTQGRADLVRSLKTEAQGLLEQHGPNVLSQQQLEILRGVSKPPASRGRSPSRQRVTLKSVSRGAASGPT